MDEQHNHKQKITKFKLSMLERMIMIPMSILSILLFVIFMLKMIHFMLIPIPALFSSPTLTHTPYTTPSYLFNFSIYLSFFVQHIVMALIIFKTSIVKFIPTYPLYERYIYNICSSWYYIVILQVVRPVALQTTIIFTTPIYLNMVMTAIFSVTFTISVVKLGSQIHMPYSYRDILFSQEIEFKGYTSVDNSQLVDTGVYGIVRHPMQSSALGQFIFASNIYTIDRLLFISACMMGIMIGIVMEEKRLSKRFLGYKQYKQKVKWMLLPYIF